MTKAGPSLSIPGLPRAPQRSGCDGLRKCTAGTSPFPSSANWGREGRREASAETVITLIGGRAACGEDKGTWGWNCPPEPNLALLTPR